MMAKILNPAVEDQIYKEIIRNRGNLAAVSRVLDIPPTTLREWIMGTERLAQALEDERVLVGEEIQNKIIEEALAGNVTMLIIYANIRLDWTESKQAEKVKINDTNTDLELTKEKYEEFNRLLAGWSNKKRLAEPSEVIEGKVADAD